MEGDITITQEQADGSLKKITLPPAAADFLLAADAEAQKILLGVGKSELLARIDVSAPGSFEIPTWTYVELAFPDVLTDPYDLYDPLTGDFTIPADGVYSLEISLLTSLPDFLAGGCNIFKNGSGYIAQEFTPLGNGTQNILMTPSILCEEGDVLRGRVFAAYSGTGGALNSEYFAQYNKLALFKYA